MKSVWNITVASPTPVERRRHPRTSLRMTLSGIRLDPDGDLMESLQMLDISRGGIGAYCARSFYPGQKIVLCLPQTSDRGRRNVYASVVRCGQMEGGYRVGLHFDSASVASSCQASEAVAAA